MNNKEKMMKKIASMILGASIATGTTLGMTGCNEADNEIYYATKLYDRLVFKMEKDYDLCGDDIDFIDYNYAIVKGDYTIGLTLTADYFHYYSPSERDVLETRFIVDKEFYDKFISSDLEDLSTLYTLSDEMIINYEPTSIKLNGTIVYTNTQEQENNSEDTRSK